jgi:hypothetical protein
MLKSHLRSTRTLGVLAALAVAAVMPAPGARAQFATTPTLFSGQATAVKGKILGIPITLVDTGTVAPEGGKLEAHLLCYPAGEGCVVGVPDLTNNALHVQVLNATVVAQGHQSRARASVADLVLDLGAVDVSATLVDAEASAMCADGRAIVKGESELVNLTINGTPIVVTGEVNQTVTLPNGLGVVVINEQIAKAEGGTGDITVRALHIIVPGPLPGTDTDVVIAEAHADIACGRKFCPVERDFVTGGGWFEDSSRKNFAVAGGIKNGFWGHLMYIDHGTRTKVKGTGVTDYKVTGPTSRHIEGTYEIDGKPGPGKYEADVDDQGEPGRADTFRLALNGVEVANGTLRGGNIQLHTCK